MKALSRIYVLLIYLFLYAPIFILVLFSFNSSSTMSRSVFSGFSLRWYRRLLQDHLIMEALRNTLIIAVVAALFATVLGTLGAIGMNSLHSKWQRRIVTNVTNLPMVNPEIVTGVSMMLLFVLAAHATGSSLGIGSLILAHITFCVPYVILSVRPKLLQMDAHLYEAAQDLGCTPVQAFSKVVFPQILPGILTGAILSFTLSIDDFVISYFTSGTTQTLPIYIYAMTRKRVSPEINALSTLLFAVVLLLLLLINVRQSGREARRLVEEATTL